MKQSRTRYYSEEDQEVGVTRSELKRLGRRRQLEYMRFWFHEHFEDPAQETPFNSREGGYLFIMGGPYDASEELQDEFGEIIPLDRILEVVADVESDGIADWAPGKRHLDQVRAGEEWKAEQEEDVLEDPLSLVSRWLEGGAVPQFGIGDEPAERQAILTRLDLLEATLATLTPIHGGLGHNNPPVEDDPLSDQIVEAKEACAEIRQELGKDKPDVLAVVRATSRLKLVRDWIFKKADIAAEAFSRALGDTAGKAVVAVGGVYVTAESLPKIAHLVTEVVGLTTKWAQQLSLPF